MPLQTNYEKLPPTHKKKLYTIIYADDHELVRHGISEYIYSFPSFKVVRQASNGKELAEAIINGCKPDIALLDIEMPKMNGYETASWLKLNYPKIKIVMLSVFDSPHAISLAISAGADAFICKDIESKAMEDILLKVVVGLHINFTQKIPVLSEKELSFLKWVCTNLTYKEIATKMNLSYRMVERTREDVFTKFDISNRTSLALFAVKNGIYLNKKV